MKLILTGGIASGKTAVTEYLRTKGFEVIDADRISRAVVAPPSPVLDEIVREFGTSVLHADGTLNRRVLRETVFRDPAKAKRLNELTHPEIFRRLQTALDEARGDAVAAVPLYFETPYRLLGADAVWTVEADRSERIKRAARRDNIDREQAKAIADRQAEEELRMRCADLVFRNDGSLEELYRRVEDALARR